MPSGPCTRAARAWRERRRVEQCSKSSIWRRHDEPGGRTRSKPRRPPGTRARRQSGSRFVQNNKNGDLFGRVAAQGNFIICSKNGMTIELSLRKRICAARVSMGCSQLHLKKRATNCPSPAPRHPTPTGRGGPASAATMACRHGRAAEWCSRHRGRAADCVLRRPCRWDDLEAC